MYMFFCLFLMNVQKLKKKKNFPTFLGVQTFEEKEEKR